MGLSPTLIIYYVPVPPDLDVVLFYVPIAQGVITKRSQATIPYTDNRPTSTNHVQACTALIRKMVQHLQINLDKFLCYGSNSGWFDQ